MPRRRSCFGRFAAFADSGSVAGGGHFRTASGLCGIGGLDHRTQKCVVGGVLLRCGTGVSAFCRGAGTGSEPPRWYWYLGALVLFIAALLSKTVTCSLPAALLLVSWWKKGRVQRGDILPLLPFFVLGVGLGLLTAWIEKYHVGAQGAAWSLTFSRAVSDRRTGLVVLCRQTGVAGASDLHLSALEN